MSAAGLLLFFLFTDGSTDAAALSFLLPASLLTECLTDGVECSVSKPTTQLDFRQDKTRMQTNNTIGSLIILKLTGKSAKLKCTNFLHKKKAKLRCSEKILFYSSSF